MTAIRQTPPEFTSLREKLRWEKDERSRRYARYSRICAAAHRAAHRAAMARPCTGDSGVAWVSLQDGRSSFAYWARKNGWSSSPSLGTYRDVPAEYGQGLDRQIAYARAYAMVLNAKGITVTVNGTA